MVGFVAVAKLKSIRKAVLVKVTMQSIQCQVEHLFLLQTNK